MHPIHPSPGHFNRILDIRLLLRFLQKESNATVVVVASANQLEIVLKGN